MYHETTNKLSLETVDDIEYSQMMIKNVCEKMNKANLLMTISTERLPLDNIALLLLFDVSNFYCCEQVHNVRYRPETKLFWTTSINFFMGDSCASWRSEVARGRHGQNLEFEDYLCYSRKNIPNPTR